MNLRHKNYKITKKEEDLEATNSAKPLRKKLNDKLGKNRVVVYYNDKIFEFIKRERNAGLCVGCFFNNKKICPRTTQEEFPCGEMVLKLVKLK